MDSTFTRLRSLMAAEFDLDPQKIQPASNLSSLGIDSLAALEFMFALEDEFQIRIGDNHDLREGAVQDLVDLVERAVASAPTALRAAA